MACRAERSLVKLVTCLAVLSLAGGGLDTRLRVPPEMIPGQPGKRGLGIFDCGLQTPYPEKTENRGCEPPSVQTRRN